MNDGARTHDNQNHNLALYQLNYVHHIGASQGIRTPGPRLRRAMLYPTELVTLLKKMERVKGIEPSRPAWKAGILPLNYTRGAEDEIRTRDVHLGKVTLYH